MNIKEAKKHIKNTMRAYFEKDEEGKLLIPQQRQRPVLLMGPPGIGKTTIMEQIADELEVAFVSYSMTHHTRQSAIGLPSIVTKTYGGKEYKVSEYTMSEIIASVYEAMEATGKKNGILFLDEINCVSETLAPAMLQFLQYKVFGGHKVPEGWIVTTAGNPPEYNDSVREFDAAMRDRLKIINVREDYKVWKEYAEETGIHPAIISYLNENEKNFYNITTDADGICIVTARSWCDLSDIIKLYELKQKEYPEMTVDIELIGQYIQNNNIASDFCLFYSKYNKFDDSIVDTVLMGEAKEMLYDTISKFPAAQKMIFVDKIIGRIRKCCSEYRIAFGAALKTKILLKEIKEKYVDDQSRSEVFFVKLIDEENAYLLGKRKGILEGSEGQIFSAYIQLLKELNAASQNETNKFEAIHAEYIKRAIIVNEKRDETGRMIDNAFIAFRSSLEDVRANIESLVRIMQADKDFISFTKDYQSKEYIEWMKKSGIRVTEEEITDNMERIKCS